MHYLNEKSLWLLWLWIVYNSWYLCIVLYQKNRYTNYSGFRSKTIVQNIQNGYVLFLHLYYLIFFVLLFFFFLILQPFLFLFSRTIYAQIDSWVHQYNEHQPSFQKLNHDTKFHIKLLLHSENFEQSIPDL